MDELSNRTSMGRTIGQDPYLNRELAKGFIALHHKSLKARGRSRHPRYLRSLHLYASVFNSSKYQLEFVRVLLGVVSVLGWICDVACQPITIVRAPRGNFNAVPYAGIRG